MLANLVLRSHLVYHTVLKHYSEKMSLSCSLSNVNVALL
uniref:Uncharacterized protein n=1 Tax=Anguilla anguilla TaxID=7936 RepID=A0A0E9RQ04_ANGAN